MDPLKASEETPLKMLIHEKTLSVDVNTRRQTHAHAKALHLMEHSIL